MATEAYLTGSHGTPDHTDDRGRLIRPRNILIWMHSSDKAAMSALRMEANKQG